MFCKMHLKKYSVVVHRLHVKLQLKLQLSYMSVTRVPEQIPICFSLCVNEVVMLNFAGEGKDDAGYMDVSVCELKHPPPQLCPMPEGLNSQQVCIDVSVCTLNACT